MQARSSPSKLSKKDPRKSQMRKKHDHGAVEAGTEKSFLCKSVHWDYEPSLLHKKLTTLRKPGQFSDSYSSIKSCLLCLFHCFIYLIDE